MTAEATLTAPPYSRANPFPGKLVVNRRLSGPESAKDTRHLEIDLTGWGLTYEVGDSVAVYATNDPQLVDEMIHALGATGDEQVPRPKGPTTTLREALLRDYGITQPTPKFLKAIIERANSSTLLKDLLQPKRKEDLDRYLWGMEVIDFLSEHPSARFSPQEFVGLLTKLQPRLYSVASSLKVYPEQVHFIVDVIRYESHGRVRKGVASSFLAERADDVAVPVYPSVAKHFHLPENPDTPIIMVGPGTGVAPFRAYLQERKAFGAKGKNWLFCLRRGVRGAQKRGNSHTTRLRLVTRSTRKNLRAAPHNGKRCRDLEMARRRGRTLFRVRRRAPDGEGCRCSAAQNRAGTGRQKYRRSKRIRRKTKER